MNLNEFKQLEVVNLIDGRILGSISDFNLSLTEGRIDAIIVPGNSGIRNIFSNNDEYIIPWSSIKKIGEEVILVTYEGEFLLED